MRSEQPPGPPGRQEGSRRSSPPQPLSYRVQRDGERGEAPAQTPGKQTPRGGALPPANDVTPAVRLGSRRGGGRVVQTAARASWADTFWSVSRGPGTLGTLSGSLPQRRRLLPFQTRQAAGSSCRAGGGGVRPAVGAPGRLARHLLGDDGQKTGRPREASSFLFCSISFQLHRPHAALCCGQVGDGCAQGSLTHSAQARAQRAQGSTVTRDQLSVLPGAAAMWDAGAFQTPGSLDRPVSLPVGIWRGREDWSLVTRPPPAPQPRACPLPLLRLSCWGLSVAPGTEALIPPLGLPRRCPRPRGKPVISEAESRLAARARSARRPAPGHPSELLGAQGPGSRKPCCE